VLRAWLYGVLIGLDQLANTLFYGFPDETLSSRMGRRLKRKRRALESEAVCAALDVIEADHCGQSIEETPDGETDPRHLGRVNRELPRWDGTWVKDGGRPLSAESAAKLRAEANAPVEPE
jgi:hypothetical protein